MIKNLELQPIFKAIFYLEDQIDFEIEGKGNPEQKDKYEAICHKIKEIKGLLSEIKEIGDKN